jgi:hypothetical protein
MTASAQPTPALPVVTPAVASGGGTVRVVPDPDGTGTLVITDSAPVAAAADGTEIGGAQQIVRQP